MRGQLPDSGSTRDYGVEAGANARNSQKRKADLLRIRKEKLLQ